MRINKCLTRLFYNYKVSAGKYITASLKIINSLNVCKGLPLRERYLSPNKYHLNVKLLKDITDFAPLLLMVRKVITDIVSLLLMTGKVTADFTSLLFMGRKVTTDFNSLLLTGMKVTADFASFSSGKLILLPLTGISYKKLKSNK